MGLEYLAKMTTTREAMTTLAIARLMGPIRVRRGGPHVHHARGRGHGAHGRSFVFRTLISTSDIG
jgi:hypothetical protein